MAASLLRADPCQELDRTPTELQHYRTASRLAGEKTRPSLGGPVGGRLSSGEGQSPEPLHRAPVLGNTWPGGDARDTGVGASSFGRGKSRGIQTSDYLGPELLSGGSLRLVDTSSQALDFKLGWSRGG